MAAEPERYTVAPGDGWALHRAMDRIQARGEDAIVQDKNRSFLSDGAGNPGASGEYYDVWADGKLINTTDSKAHAESSLKEYHNKHPKH
jgi:hypothetical protein